MYRAASFGCISYHTVQRIYPCPPINAPEECEIWYVEALRKFADIFLLSHQCPSEHNIYIMFHGTTYAAAKEIIKYGFRPSEDGMLGKGVYVSRDMNKAVKHPYGYDPRKVVLKLRVNVGKVKKIDYRNHPLQKTWQYHGYDTAWVPPYCGVNDSGQEEDCVYNPKRLQVVDIVHGNLYDVIKLRLLLCRC